MPLPKRLSEILECFYRVGRAGAGRLSDGGGPFGFDIHHALVFEGIVAGYRPDAIVETGCFLGDTTAYLAAAYPTIPILTCDIAEGAADFTRHRTRDAGNVTVTCQDSPTLVAEAADRYGTVVHFLDAHWEKSWPLLDELAAIRTGVAVVHDFDIGHARFGYDEYDGLRCGPDLFALMPNPPDCYFTPDPEASHPVPCLQVGRRTGMGIVPINVPAAPLAEDLRLARHTWPAPARTAAP